MTRVLLAASYPEGNRGEDVRPYSLSDIDLASSAVIEGVLRRGWQFRFGRHPMISPLVLGIAHILSAGRQVELFQSAYFRKTFTEEVLRLVREEGAQLTQTEAIEHDRGASLAAMREAMLQDDIDAAFLVGGMDGLDEELMALRTHQPGAAVFLMRQPGGRTRQLADSPGIRNRLEVRVLEGAAYAALATEALGSLAP